MAKVSLWAIALVVGCGLVSVTAFARPEAHRGGTLRIGFSAIDSLDSGVAYTTPSWMIQRATCSKLFDYPDASGAAGTRLVPEVVDRYAVSSNGRTYTFDLKRTFRFSSGERVTARSFADAFNREANPAMPSNAVPYLHEIVGADAVIGGTARSISGVRVLAPFRLQISLTRRVADFPAELTIPLFCPVPSGTPDAPGGVDDPPGSGPYYVAGQIPNRQIVLKRNPYYRGNRPANPDQIVWTLGETRDACLADVEQNRLDYCAPPGFPASAARDLAGRYGVNKKGGRFHVAPGIETNFFVFNHDRPAFHGAGQIPLEKAINYAIDRRYLANVAFGYEAGKRTDQLLPPALGKAASIYPIAGAEPAIARKWLARAKFKPASLVLYASSSPSGVASAQTFAFDLKQIGIDVAISYFDIGTVQDKATMRDAPVDVAMGTWAPDYADPAGFFGPLLDGRNVPKKSGRTNLTHLNDPALNARIDAAEELTGAARRRAWADLDVDLMRTDPPWAPYINFNARVFVSQDLSCVVIHPLYDLDLAAACKK